MGIWVEQQFRAAGLETHVDGFAATVNGKDVALQNVYGVAKGRTQGTIMLIANRDVPPLATQGAGDNASGVAALLALAEAFTVTAHDHTIIFLCTTGDSYGALGARHFVETHQTDDLYAVIALRDVAKRDSDGRRAWTAGARCPRWRRRGSGCSRPRRPSGTSTSRRELPTVPAQVLRLAVPTSAGSQGPFVAAGVPAVTVSAAGPSAPTQRRHARHRVGADAHQGGHHGAEHGDGGGRHHRAGRAERRHDLPHAQGDAAGRRARRHPRRPAPAARRRDRRPVRPLPAVAHPAQARVRARRTAPRALARPHRDRLLRQPRRPAAAQPRRRDPSGLAPGRLASLPARRRPRRAHAARLRLRGGRRAAARAALRHRRPRHHPRLPPAARAHRAAAAARRTPTRCSWCCRAPSSGRSRGRAGGCARSCRCTSGCSWCRSRSSTTRCSWTSAGRSGGTSSCSSRTARSRRSPCCWRRCSSPRPACSRTRCTSADWRRASSPGRRWTGAGRSGRATRSGTRPCGPPAEAAPRAPQRRAHRPAPARRAPSGGATAGPRRPRPGPERRRGREALRPPAPSASLRLSTLLARATRR